MCLAGSLLKTILKFQPQLEDFEVSGIHWGDQTDEISDSLVPLRHLTVQTLVFKSTRVLKSFYKDVKLETLKWNDLKILEDFRDDEGILDLALNLKTFKFSNHRNSHWSNVVSHLNKFHKLRHLDVLDVWDSKLSEIILNDLDLPNLISLKLTTIPCVNGRFRTHEFKSKFPNLRNLTLYTRYVDNFDIAKFPKLKKLEISFRGREPSELALMNISP